MSRIIEPFKQFFDGAGNPLINGWLSFYQSDSNNVEKATYADSNETSANSNPLQLDSEGRCPDVFGTGSFRVISSSNDTLLNEPAEQIQVRDPVGGSSGTADFSDWSGGTAYDKGNIVKGDDGNYYESLAYGNENHNPTTSPAYWQRVAFLYIWNETINYAVGDRVTDTIDGFDYISKVTPNQNQQPSTQPTYWDNFAVKASAATVEAEGDIQVARVEDEGDTQVGLVEDQGDTQIALVIAATVSRYS